MRKCLFRFIIIILIVCFYGCSTENVLDKQNNTEVSSIPQATLVNESEITDTKYKIVKKLSGKSFNINEEQYNSIKNHMLVQSRSSTGRAISIEILQCDIEICEYKKTKTHTYFYTSLLYEDKPYINIHCYKKRGESEIFVTDIIEDDIPYNSLDWNQYFE